MMIINNLSKQDWNEIYDLISRKNALPNIRVYMRLVQLLFALLIIYGFTFVIKINKHSIEIYFLTIMAIFFVTLFANALVWKKNKPSFMKSIQNDDYNFYFLDIDNLNYAKTFINNLLTSDVSQNYKNSISEGLMDWRWITNPNLPKYTCSIETKKYLILIRPIYKGQKSIFAQSMIVPIQKNAHNLKLIDSSENFNNLLKERINKQYILK